MSRVGLLMTKDGRRLRAAPSRPDRTRRFFHTVALWTLFTGFALIGALGEPNRSTLMTAAAGILGLIPLLLLRLRFPVPAWCAALALGVLDAWFAPVSLYLSYLVGRRPAADPARQRNAGAAAVSSVLALLLVKGVWTGQPATTFTNTLPLAVASATAWLLGRYREQRQDLLAAGWLRAAQLEREQQLVADSARTRERARIAAEMHDQLGHDLTLIAMQAAALEVSPRLGEQDRQAAGGLRLQAGRAVERLGDIIGVLREGNQFPRESVEQVVARAQAAGAVIDLQSSGTDDAAPRLVQEAAARLTQEAVTNAMKHAPGAGIQVRLVHLVDATVISVENDPPVAAPTDPPGHRMGLVGLRERVDLLNGALQTGMTPAGGFRVTARMPHHGTGPAVLADPPAAATGPQSLHPEHRQAQRRVRRSLALALGLPLAATLAALGAYRWYVIGNQTLSAEQYRRLSVGSTTAQVLAHLPGEQLRVPAGLIEPAVPPAAHCQYYRSGNRLRLRSGTLIYRLCFRDGRLITKQQFERRTT